MNHLASGLPSLDQNWGGLRPGETYVVTGRAESSTAVLLRVAQATVDAGKVCVYISAAAPATLSERADQLGFDVRSAAQSQRLRLLRPPTLPDGADPAQALDGLARLVSQAGSALVVVEDTTPFLAFRDLDVLSGAVSHLVAQVHPLPTVLLLGLGAPANDRSATITARLCDAVAGSVRVDTEDSGSTFAVRLRPGTNVGLEATSGTWVPGETPVPEKARSTPSSAVPPELRGDGYGDGFGDGHAPMQGVGDQVVRNTRPAPPAALPPASAPNPTTMPSVAEMNASIADILGAPAPDRGEVPPTTAPPPAVPPPDSAPQASAPGQPQAPPSIAPVPPPETESSAAPEAPLFTFAPDDSMSASSAPLISQVNLAAATFEVNPHFQPSSFELDGGVLMDSQRPDAGPLSLSGARVNVSGQGTFGVPGAPPAGQGQAPFGDGMAAAFTGPPAFDFSGTPQFNPAPEPPKPEPATMPQFASLAQHTFDQSPRGRFAKQVQTSFDAHEAIGRPFLALALRMDPANPFAEAFPLVEDAVREAIDPRDPIYAEPERKRLLALLPERTQSAAAGIYGAIKAQLQLSGGASDAVFTAISAVTIPNGAPFANARDLMAFAFDAE